MKVRKTGSGAFTLVELLIVVAIVGVLLAIAIPNFIKTRVITQKSLCISNLRHIDAAMQQWALETKREPAAPVSFPDISAYLKGSVTCPAGGSDFSDSYVITAVSTQPVCKKSPLTHFLPLSGMDIVVTDPTGPTRPGGSGGPATPTHPTPPDHPTPPGGSGGHP